MTSTLTILAGAVLAYIWRYVWAGPDGKMRRGLAILVAVVGFLCLGFVGILVWTLFRAPALNGAIIAFSALFAVIGVTLLVSAKRAFREVI